MSVFLCDVLPGTDIAQTIVKAFHACKMAVIMGTTTYGTNTDAGYSTFEELRLIHDEGKPFFLIKMCKNFAQLETRMRLSKSIMHFEWTPGTPLPATLPQEIVRKLKSI